MLAGFRGIPKFQMRRDPSSFPDWDLYGAEEKNVLMKGYWAAYDKEYEDLEELWLGLYRKEKAEAEKRKSEEEKKKKKEKKKAVIDSGSESETDTEFRETCIGCEHAKLKCVFNYNSAGKKLDLIVQRELQSVRKAVTAISGNTEVRNRLQAESFYHQYNLQVISGLQWSLNALSNVDGQDIGLRTLENQLAEAGSVPEELQDAVVHSRSHVIERYNNIAQMCGTQMKSIAVRHRLGKGFGGRIPLLNRYGEVDSGVKRRRPQDEDTESGPSKRPRVDRGTAPEEVEAEKDKGSEVVANVDKGKGKEKEPGSEEDVEETMKNRSGIWFCTDVIVE
ncbi:hypothetical protein M422DRAFT_271342 [Sphaerobolus stellatus SS14]|uniref:Unplaced genomic scaffold SPHSTscaffold_259, whole genome shotgun sequence n=1 Tax=Sphaerobolus stellatus (strain SS14) TaxID=990650 RepID=A0A0C9UQ74_SPHS4|nr:hypothetical protein M422DRAFT_271342 [Sphaerobolus stellatus SS14]